MNGFIVKSDKTFVMDLNGQPYHVIKDDPLYEELALSYEENPSAFVTEQNYYLLTPEGLIEGYSANVPDGGVVYDPLNIPRELLALREKSAAEHRIREGIAEIAQLEERQARPIRAIIAAQLAGEQPPLEDVALLQRLDEQISDIRAELSVFRDIKAGNFLHAGG